MDTVLRAVAVCAMLVLPGPMRGETAFCVSPPHHQICAEFPQDQTDFSRFFEYRVVDRAAQTPFDTHAWQAFVALNWSDVAPGSGPRGWRGFERAAKPGPCGAPQDTTKVVAFGTQSDGHALVDQAGNFVVYETRLNDTAAGYIASNRLDSADGRDAFLGQIDFPKGVDDSQPASVLIKTAWRILEAPSADYIQAQGQIVVPEDQALSGQGHCVSVDLGLIGMHIVTKVASGHGDKWLWSTFEHRRNVPTAKNTREINSLYAPDLFPSGCHAPDGEPEHTLFDPTCPDCPTNVPPPLDVRWASAPPFARTPDGTPAPVSQIVRCWRIFGPTQETNAAWQAKLSGTPLAQYMLVSSQWRGANPDPIFTHGELPRYLSNTTMETYLQTDPDGSCLGCHAGATTAEGRPSDFTFLLRN